MKSQKRKIETIIRKVKKERILSIDYLKAIAIIFVVVGHSLTYYAENYGKLSLFGEVTCLLICSVHVPLFFIIGGYLCHRQEIRRYIASKVKRILVPFITFSVLKLIYIHFFEHGTTHGLSLVDQLIDAFVFGRFYWFAYCIFGIYLIAILYWEKDKKNYNNTKILISIIVLLLVNTIFALAGRTYIFDINIFQINYIIKYLPFFLIGYFISENKEKTKSLAKSKIILVLTMIIIVLLTILILVGYVPNIYPITFVMAICLSYCLFRIVSLIKKNFQLITIVGKYSLQIMFLDSFMKVALFLVITRFTSVSTTIAFFIAVGDVILCVLLSVMLEKIPIINRAVGL